MSNFVLKDDQKKIMLLDFRISALTPLPSELSCFMLTCQQSGEPFPLEGQDPVHTVNNRLGRRECEWGEGREGMGEMLSCDDTIHTVLSVLGSSRKS